MNYFVDYGGGFIKFKYNKITIVIWITLVFSFYGWISFKFVSNLIQFWLIGIFLSFMVVFLLHKNFPLWKIPVITIGFDLIYHLSSAIELYYVQNSITEPIYHTPFLQTLQNSYADNFMTFVLADIPFVILTISFTIGFYIYEKVQDEIF